MDDRSSLIRNIVIVIGFIAAVIIALVVRANLPETLAKYSGLMFFSLILLIGGLVGFLASKFIK